MITRIFRVASFLAAILTVHLKIVKGDDTGHFQVHNEQEGNLKIHATKEIAQVSSF